MRIYNREMTRPVQAGERRIRLLVVDENPTALEVLGRRLSHLGHDVTLADSGLAATNLLLAQRFDLVLIEMEMPTLSGVQTLKKMRGSGLLGNASVIMVTGRGDSSVVIEALNAGADDHMAKPFDFEILDAKIRHIIARANQLGQLTRHNESLDARIARRAVELGEARAELEGMQSDRARLVASIQALHDEIERMNAGE